MKLERFLNPEERLLVGCTKCFLEPSLDLGKIVSHENFDWEKVYEIACRHGVVPILGHWIHEFEGDPVPEKVRQKIQKRNFHNLQKNLLLTMEMSKIEKILESEGIPVAAFKGPVLAEWAYGNVGLREFVDLDLVVPDSKFALLAKNVLISRGYHLDYDLNPALETHFLRTQCEYHLFSPDRKTFIEIHWKIFHDYFSFPFSISDAWRRMIHVKVLERDQLSFSPEDSILILCAHATKHTWSRMIWIIDIALLIRKNPGIDWNRLLGSAEALGSKRMLFFGLYLVEKLFGLSFPQNLKDKINGDVTLNSLGKMVFRQWRRKATEKVDFRFELKFLLKSRERLSDRLRFLFLGTIIPSASDFSGTSNLGIPLSLYYLWRPIRLLRRFLGNF